MQVRYTYSNTFWEFVLYEVVNIIGILSHSYGFTVICSVLLRFLRYVNLIISIIKTFNNEKGCRDDKQKKGKNKVGMCGMRTPSE